VLPEFEDQIFELDMTKNLYI